MSPAGCRYITRQESGVLCGSITSAKSQIISKYPMINDRKFWNLLLGIWDLFGIWNFPLWILFGIWDLGFHIR
jgi:hypothetical protein